VEPQRVPSALDADCDGWSQRRVEAFDVPADVDQLLLDELTRAVLRRAICCFRVCGFQPPRHRVQESRHA
jgi:hypothetical protein